MMVCDTILRPVPDDILEKDAISIEKPVITTGGDALNVAVGSSKLGLQVTVAGRIADDLNGRFIRQVCDRNRINTAGLVNDVEHGTACSYALIDRNGERHFLSSREIFHALSCADISDELIKNSDAVYFGSVMCMKKMDEGGIADVFERAHKFGKLTVMDAAVNNDFPQRDWMKYLEPVFSETDIFFPSIDELKYMTGISNPEEAVEIFRPFHMKYFGVKLSSKGCYVTDFGKGEYIRSAKINRIADTDGAGDSFMAGLICAVSHNMDIFHACKFASCVAGKNVESYGGTEGIPGYEEALKLLEKYDKDQKI